MSDDFLTYINDYFLDKNSRNNKRGKLGPGPSKTPSRPQNPQKDVEKQRDKLWNKLNEGRYPSN